MRVPTPSRGHDFLLTISFRVRSAVSSLILQAKFKAGTADESKH